MWQSKQSFLLLLAVFCVPITCTISTNSTDTSDVEARQGRIMHLIKDRRAPIMKLKSRPVPYTHTKILARNDHYPLRHPPHGSAVNKRHPIMRRVQTPGIYPYEHVKNERYQPHKKSTSLHREFAAHSHPHSHPNALSQTFKASPHFSGQAIVRPVYELLAEAQKTQTDALPPVVQQYPLPQETPKRPIALNYLNQQEQYVAPQQQQHYTQQQQQYAVYEEPETAAEQHVTTVKFANAADAKDALEFIQFMGSDAYFLPKHEPDYRVMDDERDRQIYQQQYNLQQQQQEYTYHKAQAPSVSQLIYSQPPPPPPPSSTLPRNSHIVQGSYQTGKNIFVVNSDGNKAVKHIVSSTPQTLSSVLDSARYKPTLRRRTPEPLRFEFTEQDAVVHGYTRDPTKHLNYVSSTMRPSTTQSLLPQSHHHHPHHPRVTTAGNIGYQHRPTSTSDDPVDEDDIQHLHADILGRVPLSSTTASSTPPSEQKDTEDYCERICANVQDNDEEIICGSDGYMYTSEAQLECYASCLQLDVTITGKGTCTAR